VKCSEIANCGNTQNVNSDYNEEEKKKNPKRNLLKTLKTEPAGSIPRPNGVAKVILFG
jgi:hypothetical protein